MTADSLAADAALAASLVREAGRLAARMRAGGLDPETKTGVADLVTAADRAAESLVVERLAAERPDDGVLGEEGATREGTSSRTWVIDPVDGTWNFVSGLGWWCSALALVDGPPDGDGSGLLLGAVHHAGEDETYLGGPGLPGTCNGRALARLTDVSLGESGVATYLHPGLQDTPVGEAFGRAVAHAATVRMLGSASMDATAVARGVLGAAFQCSLPPWDRLPGEALVRSVGGEVARVDAGGRTWSVAGAPTAVAELVAALSQATSGRRGGARGR